MKCKNPSCQKQTSNPKYCSSSCAAQVNNRITPKRQPEHKCKNCNKPINSKRRYCSQKCKNESLNHLDWDNATISDVKAKRSSQRHSQIRDNARNVYKVSGKPEKCAVCGYDIHIEICHIKAISDFPLDTLITEVNSPDNLMALCPNHHWEFDNLGLIISIH